MPFAGKFKGISQRKKRAQPIDIITVMTGQKVWWQSTTIQGLVVLVLGFLADKVSWLPVGDYGPVVEAVATAIGSVMVAIGRIKAEDKIVIRKPEVVE